MRPFCLFSFTVAPGHSRGLVVSSNLSKEIMRELDPKWVERFRSLLGDGFSSWELFLRDLATTRIFGMFCTGTGLHRNPSRRNWPPRDFTENSVRGPATMGQRPVETGHREKCFPRKLALTELSGFCCWGHTRNTAFHASVVCYYFDVVLRGVRMLCPHFFFSYLVIFTRFVLCFYLFQNLTLRSRQE